MYDQLLQQAKRLARLDARKPKQGNLRRAISSAYYALFHFLVDESCRLTLGSQHGLSRYRQVLGRAFEHGTMKQACVAFGGATLKANVAKGFPASFAVTSEVKRIAAAFVELQGYRHVADYDLTETFMRSNVLTAIEQTAASIRIFKSSAMVDETKFFLVCLWAWKNLSNR